MVSSEKARIPRAIIGHGKSLKDKVVGPLGEGDLTGPGGLCINGNNPFVVEPDSVCCGVTSTLLFGENRFFLGVLAGWIKSCDHQVAVIQIPAWKINYTIPMISCSGRLGAICPSPVFSGELSARKHNWYCAFGHS